MHLKTVPRHRAVAAAIGILILGGLLAASGHVIAADHGHDQASCVVCSWYQYQSCVAATSSILFSLAVFAAAISVSARPWAGAPQAPNSRAPPQ